MSGISPIGHDWNTVETNLRERRGGVVHHTPWDQYDKLRTRLAAPVKGFAVPEHYPRKKLRSMGRVAQMAVRTAELALDDAGLLDDPTIRDGHVGVAYGSSTGSTEPIGSFYRLAYEGDIRGINATSYLQMMGHTCTVNIGLFFELTGRIIPSGTACTSGSLAIGTAYESIKYGLQTIMIAGGGEELCVTEAGVFDVLFATSTRNDAPDTTPRPFDRDRDGLVIGEGAGTLILEELEHAKARGATIYAELVGYGHNSDGCHITNPAAATMQRSMELSLECADLPADAIGYINAHATATDLGDIAESKATYNLFGSKVPVSSLKSYMGHTLGASGSLEAWFSIEMMNRDWYAPTIHLENVDERCGELDYMKTDRSFSSEYIMTNNFAFGGINTSLIFKRWS
jgi:3-oxoacyl-[acyl-carrier-protein] synthase II